MENDTEDIKEHLRRYHMQVYMPKSLVTIDFYQLIDVRSVSKNTSLPDFLVQNFFIIHKCLTQLKCAIHNPFCRIQTFRSKVMGRYMNHVGFDLSITSI